MTTESYTNSTTVAEVMNTTLRSKDPATPMKGVLNGLLGLDLVCSIYLFVVLLIHEQSLKSNIASMIHKNARGAMLGGGAGTSRKVGRGLRALCITSAALCIGHTVVDLVNYNVEIDSKVGCTVSKNFGVTMLTMLDVTIYSFLWLRQYLVYRNLAFENKITKNVINVLKWTTLSFIIGIFVTTNSLLVCCRRYEYDEANSKCESTTAKAVDTAMTYIWTAGSIVLHCTLVLMFVFPLVRLEQKNLQKRPAAAASASQKRMKKLVRRCLIVSIACVGSDVFVMAFTDNVIDQSHQSQLRHLLYNINVLLNSTLIVVSFREWRQMLLPCVKAPATATVAVLPAMARAETTQNCQGENKH